MMRGRCNVVGCSTAVAETRVFCDPHESLLHDDTREALYRKHRPGKPRTKVFERVLDEARREIRYAERAGHRIERNGALEL